MNTTVVTQEQISAFVDGELDDPYIDAALASLRQSEQKKDWEIYHQIGDVLRSDDMARDVSPDFMARLAKRLDSEPAIVAPGVLAANTAAKPATVSRPAAKRRTLSGLVAASAVAAAAYFSVPPLMVAFKSGSEAPSASATVAASGSAPVEALPVKAAGLAVNAPPGQVMRDAQIDDYLYAHQRYSPSVYSTAQYARPATHSTESNR